jgi:pimeloyl-ACP methyl ester carboxylesterase
MGLDSRIWDYVPEFLSSKYKVVTYDLRGHGRSFAPESDYSIRDHVSDLKLLISELGIERLSLLGHSLGGAIAVKYALEAPGKAVSMFLAAPHIAGYTDYPQWPNLYRTARLIDVDQARIAWETFRLFHKLREGTPAKDLFLKCLSDFNGNMWLDAKAGRYMEESDVKLLEKLSMPLMLLCGRDDHDFLPLAKTINAHVRHGTLYEVPECAHMIHLEKPDIFKRELKAFFNV